MFTQDGLCAGYTEFNGEFAVGVAAWQDEQGGDVDGFRNGETIAYRLWDTEGGFEVAIDADDVQVVAGQNAFAAGGFLVVRLSGNAPAQGVVLQPEESIAVQVFFNPQAVQDYDEALTIISDNRDNGEVEVPLMGVGLVQPPPEIAVSDEEHDFGLNQFGDPAEWELEISNVGYLDLEVTRVEFGDGAFSYIL